MAAVQHILQGHILGSKQSEPEVAQAADTHAGAVQSNRSASGALSAFFGTAVSFTLHRTESISFMFYDFLASSDVLNWVPYGCLMAAVPRKRSWVRSPISNFTQFRLELTSSAACALL
jgi:hypothetical protein